MKTISLDSPHVDGEWLFDQAAEDSLCVSLPDGRRYLVNEVDDGGIEAAQMAANKELMEIINKRPAKTYSMEESRRMLGV